ncbi:MAG: DinB family protein [Candidatus Pacebacteria bacterium]|nr:DinB family protein [Candidatus Paceibacterota bacterium]
MKREKKIIEEKGIILETLLKGWQETRQLTLDWINTLSLEQLNQELPRSGLNSYTKHIYEMGEIQKMYTAALTGEEPNMEKVTSLTFKSEKVTVKTKEELKHFLNECDERFYMGVNKVKDWEEKVSIFGVDVPKLGIIELLIRHETLHHGQFIAFGYTQNIQFPQSWIDVWALPVK